MKHVLWMLALSVIVLSSCQRESSDSVDQDKIYTEFELFYNANLDKTFARATFKFSNAFGTKLELANPSTVNFDGQTLTFNTVLAYYERELAGFVESGTFTWTDTEGQSFTNTISVKPIDYSGAINAIAKDSSFELGWAGDPLQANELVVVTINGENEGDAQIFSTNDVGSTSIILGKDKLEQLGTGPGTVWMDRSTILPLNEGTSAGGTIIGRYRPENQSIQIQ